MTQGSTSYVIKNKGSADQLVVSDGSNELLTMARTSGATALLGDLTVGAAAGASAATISSSDSRASLSIQSGGSSPAVVTAQAQTGSDAKLVLTSGSSSIELLNDAAQNAMVIRNGTTDLLPFSTATGAKISGGFTVGGGSGPRSATIKSTTGQAKLAVTSAGSGTASVTVASAAQGDAQVVFEENSVIKAIIKSDGANDRLVITDGSTDLVGVSRSTGAMSIKGDLTVGAGSSPVSMTVKSTDSSAGLHVVAGGSATAEMTLESGASSQPKLILAETGGTAFTLINTGGNTKKFKIMDGEYSSQTYDLLEISSSATSSDMITRGDLTVGGVNVTGAIATTVTSSYGSATLDVVTAAGEAISRVTSGGAFDATVEIKAPTGQKATLKLSEGGSSFAIVNDGSDDTLKVTNGSSSGGDLIRLTKLGAMWTAGGLTVGASNGAKAMTVSSNNGAASMTVSSGGVGSATLAAISASGISSLVRLAEGSNTFELRHEASAAKFVIRNATAQLVGIDRVTGAMTLEGDLTVGNSHGAKSATIKSTNAAASLAVVSGGSGVATISASAANNADAKVVLTEGTNSFEIMNQGNNDKLAINDGTNDLLTVARGTGSTVLRGNLTVGTGTGARALSVASTDSAAAIAVTATGGDATVELIGSSSANAKVTLSRTGGASYHLLNDGASSLFKLREGGADLLTVASYSAGSTVTTGGDLKVGSTNTVGPRAATVGSESGSASMSVESSSGEAAVVVASGGSYNARVYVQAPTGYDSQLELTHGGTDTIKILHDGSEGKLAINDGTNDLFTVAKTTGAVWTKSDLIVGNAAAAAHATIRSTGAAATLSVESGGTAEAAVVVKSATGIDSSIQLAHGSSAFHLRNAATADQFKISDGTYDLLTVARTTGSSVFRGDVTVGAASGARAMTVKSTSGASTMTVASGGSGVAQVLVQAPSGVDSVLKLTEGANTYELLNDASAGKFAIRDGTSDLFTVQRATGNTFIKGTISVGSIGASITGTPKSDTDGVVLTNRGSAVDMDNTRISLTYKQYYYDASTPAAVTAAKITAGTETDWTSTASTQDAFLSFNVVAGGTLTERVRVSSAGNLGIGTISPDKKLTVVGDASIRDDLTVGGTSVNGARTATVKSADNTASLHVLSSAAAATATVESTTASASVMIKAAASGQDAKLELTQGSSTFTMLHKGSSDAFLINDGTNDVFSIARATSDATLRGSLAVGGGSGARALTLKSTNANAALAVTALTSGTASIKAKAASGQTAQLALTSGSNTFTMKNDGGSGKLSFTDGTNELLSIAPSTGAFHSRGSLTIGQTTGAAAATIKSTSAAATLTVSSTAGAASASVSAASGSNAKLGLTQGASSFEILHNATSGKLHFTDGSSDLMSIAQADGAMATRGDVTVGGTGTSGAKAISVASGDSTANLAVTSGGTSAATVSVTSPSGQDAAVNLVETGGKSWFLKSKGSSNDLILGESSNDWLKIEQSGSAVFKGDLTTLKTLTVGGSTTTGAKTLKIETPDGVGTLAIEGSTAALSVTANGTTSDAAVTISAKSGRSSGLSLKEDGGQTFHLLNDGANDMFKIRDTSDLLTIATSSGDTTLKGGLDVKSGSLKVDSTTGFVGVHSSNPTAQLHVNGSMKLENGDLDIGNGKFYVKYATGHVGVNTNVPSEAMHIKGNLKVEPDVNGRGGNLFATQGAMHFNFEPAKSGQIDRNYYVVTQSAITLPTDQSSSCSTNCLPTASRIYWIRNKSSSNTVTIGSLNGNVKVYKNGVQASLGGGMTMQLSANGFAMCAFNVDDTRYDCWTWNE